MKLLAVLLLVAPLLAQDPCQVDATTWVYYYAKTQQPDGLWQVEQTCEPPQSAAPTPVDQYAPTCLAQPDSSVQWDRVTHVADLAAGVMTARIEPITAAPSGPLVVTVADPQAPGGGPWAWTGFALELDNNPASIAVYFDKTALADAIAASWAPGQQCKTIRVRQMWTRSYHRPDVPRWDAVVHQGPVAITVSVGN